MKRSFSQPWKHQHHQRTHLSRTPKNWPISIHFQVLQPDQGPPWHPKPMENKTGVCFIVSITKTLLLTYQQQCLVFFPAKNIFSLQKQRFLWQKPCFCGRNHWFLVFQKKPQDHSPGPERPPAKRPRRRAGSHLGAQLRPLGASEFCEWLRTRSTELPERLGFGKTW